MDCLLVAGPPKIIKYPETVFNTRLLTDHRLPGLEITADQTESLEKAWEVRVHEFGRNSYRHSDLLHYGVPVEDALIICKRERAKLELREEMLLYVGCLVKG